MLEMVPKWRSPLQGRVVEDDPSDDTSRVRFPPPLNIETWLPTQARTKYVKNEVDLLKMEKWCINTGRLARNDV